MKTNVKSANIALCALRSALCTLHSALILVLLSGCTDDTPDLCESARAEQTAAAVVAKEMTLQQYSRYYIFSADGGAPAEGASVKTNASWLKLTSDVVGRDGRIQFLADDNYADRGRSATISVKQGSRTIASCNVYQKGNNDNAGNASKEYFCVGCGYNIYGDYQSRKSLCDPVFNLAAVKSLAGAAAVQKALASASEVKYYTSTSFYQMENILTNEMESQRTGIAGSKMTVKRFTKETLDEKEHSYVFLKQYHKVAMATLDFSYIEYVLKDNEGILTDEFREARRKVIQEPTEKNINELFDKFGTHIVTSAEVGVGMDITLNFNRHLSGELNMRAEDFSRYFFKQKPSAYQMEGGRIKDVVDANYSLQINGGSKAAKEAVERDCKTLGRITRETMDAWFKSVPNDPVNNSFDEEALVPQNVKLVPIWSVFPQSCGAMMLKCAMNRAEQSAYTVSAYKAGTDYYAVSLTPQQLTFDDGDDATLVRVLYARNGNVRQPILEICSEYVPEVRGDKRITVIYAIRNGSVDHGHGLFPGEKDGGGYTNAPAWLTFSEGKVYVRPVDKIGDTIYYMHGNLYTKTYGIGVTSPELTTEDHTLTVNHLSGYSYKPQRYPIVKIGDGYWTRKNIMGSMQFGDLMDKSKPDGKCYTREEVKNGTLYANFFCINDAAFRKKNPGYGGDKQWRLPSVSDAENMSVFLGKNLKQLFKRQATGFNAQFSGAFMRIDIMGEKAKKLDAFGMRYEGEYCFVACRDREAQEGRVMALDKNYNLLHKDVKYADKNYYPIRLFHSAECMYKDK